MKNVQVIDGAVNSIFEIYEVPEALFELMFPDQRDVAFLSDVERAFEGRCDDPWAWLHRNSVAKRQVVGIHGTLHLTGSGCLEEYFPDRRESRHL